jgi:uncharacterized repeat protein (TIGR03803 family)
LNFLPNIDGAQPLDSLILLGNTLYGTTSSDGNPGLGTVFAVNTDGTSFTVLYRFIGGAGTEPVAGLSSLGNTLYGTTRFGGSLGDGTVFGLSFPLPQLTITNFVTNVILTWPTNIAGFNYSGFTLQSTTNLISPVFWSSVSGQFAVTNSISGTGKSYRLSQ